MRPRGRPRKYLERYPNELPNLEVSNNLAMSLGESGKLDESTGLLFKLLRLYPGEYFLKANSRSTPSRYLRSGECEKSEGIVDEFLSGRIPVDREFQAKTHYLKGMNAATRVISGGPSRASSWRSISTPLPMPSSPWRSSKSGAATVLEPRPHSIRAAAEREPCEAQELLSQDRPLSVASGRGERMDNQDFALGGYHLWHPFTQTESFLKLYSLHGKIAAVAIHLADSEDREAAPPGEDEESGWRRAVEDKLHLAFCLTKAFGRCLSRVRPGASSSFRGSPPGRQRHLRRRLHPGDRPSHVHSGRRPGSWPSTTWPSTACSWSLSRRTIASTGEAFETLSFLLSAVRTAYTGQVLRLDGGTPFEEAGKAVE